VIGGNIGADFHTAMVATAPGEKLLTGRRLVRNWARRTTSSVFLCRKLHLFLGKSTETAATRAALFHSNMHQIVCRLRLHLSPHWGAYIAPPDPLAVLRGPTCKGREGERRGRERRGGEGGSSSFAPGRKRKVGAYVW